MMKTKNSNYKNPTGTLNAQSGFTLIEMAIGMIIISLVIAFSVVAFSAAIQRGFDKKTFEDMERVADSIAVYAQKHMRIPCPADPANVATVTAPKGAERNSGPIGNAFGTCVGAQARGIVPYVTLGLSERSAKDRYGNFFTYHVSATSAETPMVAQTRQINNWCMTEPHWFKDTNGDGTPDRYINLAKAAFCCGTWQNIGGDIIIQDAYGAMPSLSRNSGTAGAGGVVGEYMASNEPSVTLAELQNTIPPVFPAYVLISHGQNASVAFTPTGAAASLVGLSVPEAENADNDNIYFTSDRLATVTPTGTPLFRPNIDDIVLWETPAQILGRIGAVSCARP